MISTLLSVNGLAVLASKRYYFGVGGGVFELEQIIRDAGESSTYLILSKSSFEDGFSNIRDIVVLKRVT